MKIVLFRASIDDCSSGVQTLATVVPAREWTVEYFPVFHVQLLILQLQ